jgi:deoxyribonuclease V
MSIDTHLPWTYDLNQAIRLQEILRPRLKLTWDDRPVNTIGGIDVSYANNSVSATIAVFRFPDLTRLRTVTGEAPQGFPYIPGLLAYRVGPAILAAWKKLTLKPDLLLIHGQGTAHPRGIGLASHVGLWINLPTIGVAKTHLYGCQTEPGLQVGDFTELLDEHNRKNVIGAALQTQVNSRPVYVSAGHLIDLQHSIAFVLACCRGYRMPEPVRLAHQVANSSQPSSSPRLYRF